MEKLINFMMMVLLVVFFFLTIIYLISEIMRLLGV